ncbi:MAG: DNA gyrase inhibitor YacG [Planctomycetota bacterium]|jgi:endogenous inhibitor of DNA gyrase (YacG/DUF329 family)
MGVPSRARCPTCRRPVETARERRPPDYPFCSQRCRLVDLHHWLTESYRIPVARRAPDDPGSEA